jgi:CRP-like cAMP-binding protein
LEWVEYKFGEDVIRSGELVNHFYLIAEGKARVIDPTENKNITLAVLAPGHNFGEESLLSGNFSPVTVRASSDLILYKLSKAEFERILDQFPLLENKLKGYVQQQAKFRFFRNLKLFSSLKLSEAYKYQQKISYVKLPAGEFLFTAGQTADAAYVVYSGSIRLVSDRLDQTTLGIIKAGNMCGEIALLAGSKSTPYFVSAIAAEDTVVWRLPRQVFAEVASRPKIEQELIQIVDNHRLQYQTILANDTKQNVKEELSNRLSFRKVKLDRKGLVKSWLTYATVDNPLLGGIAALATVNHYFQKQIDLHPLIEKQLVQGCIKQCDVNAPTPQKRSPDLISTSRLNDERLDQLSDFPALIEYGDTLCLLISVAKYEITLIDPLKGIIKCDRYGGDFEDNWNGKVLTFKIVPNLGNFGQKTQLMFQQFIPWLRPYASILIWVIVLSFLSQFLGLAEPLFSQIIIDGVLDKGNYSLLGLIVLGMLIVTGFQLVGSSLQQILVTQAMKRISISLLLRFFQHILALPKAVFSQWQVGDFTVRLYENENLLQLVSQSGFTVIINSITSLFYLVILLNQNAKLTGVALIFVIASALLLIISTPLLRANDRHRKPLLSGRG